MDEGVLRAMARWPDVPAVFGWLSLDRRGRWLIKGEGISNRAALAFIARNYAGDERGRWYFQNGPQRVFVRLDYTPWVLRLEAGGGITDHTGTAFGPPSAAFLDEDGAVLLTSARGVGLLDDRDLGAFSTRLRGGGGEALDDAGIETRLDALAGGGDAALGVALAAGPVPVHAVRRADVPARFGFDPDPRADG